MTLSVLVSARKNSKYLAKFLIGYFERTHNLKDIEILVMVNAQDEWNRDLMDFYSKPPWNVKFYEENKELGRAGLHEYFNELADHAKGDWLIYFCEDHYIVKDGWDNHVRRMADGVLYEMTPQGTRLNHENGKLNPADIWVLVPKFDNVGAMNHIVSRGFYNAMEGKIGNHGWIDSYLNDLLRDFPERVLHFNHFMFTDFSHYHPNPMSDAHLQSNLSTKGEQLPEYKSLATEQLLKADSERLKRRLG